MVKDNRFSTVLANLQKDFLPFILHSVLIHTIFFFLSKTFSTKGLLISMFGKALVLPIALLIAIMILSRLHQELHYAVTGQLIEIRSFQLFFYSFFPVFAAGCLLPVPYLGKVVFLLAIVSTPFYVISGTKSLFSITALQKAVIFRSFFIALGLATLAALAMLTLVLSFLK